MTADGRIAIYPGSFDPITLGHEDIARRALRLSDRLVIAIARTSSEEKRGMFSVPERLELIREVFKGEERVEAAEFEGLLVDFVRETGASLVVRGVRGVNDLEYELRMAQTNRAMNPAFETVFFAPAPERSFISASLVREIARLGGDVGGFVSAPVLMRIRERVGAAR